MIGINDYPRLPAEAQLQRAVTDAESVGDALDGLGFRVTRVTRDASADAILGAFDRFAREIQRGDTVMFYYAGHGISLDDSNYLLPSDTPVLGPEDELLAKRHAIAERAIKQQLQRSGARVIVVVLDACRNSPFPENGTRSVGTGLRGLARIEPANGVFSIYSAREGQVAIDHLGDSDTDPNSLFTRVFLKDLPKQGMSLSELGDDVRDEVAALAAANGRNQVPAVSNDLVGARRVFLAGPTPELAVVPKSAPSSVIGNDVFEQDVRERAFFGRRLKAIEEEQRAFDEAQGRERARAETEAARAALDAEIKQLADDEAKARTADAAKADAARALGPGWGGNAGGVAARGPASRPLVDPGTPSILADPSTSGRY